MKDRTVLTELLTPTIEGLGYELWGLVVIPQGRYTTLRIYIDKEEGITVDDCERVSRQVSAILDVEDPIHGTYTLEVSSPGIDRPIFTLKQFMRFVKAQVNVRLHVPVENRRHLKGEIQNVRENEIIILVDDQEFAIAHDNIARANLIPGKIL